MPRLWPKRRPLSVKLLGKSTKDLSRVCHRRPAIRTSGELSNVQRTFRFFLRELRPSPLGRFVLFRTLDVTLHEGPLRSEVAQCLQAVLAVDCDCRDFLIAGVREDSAGFRAALIGS